MSENQENSEFEDDENTDDIFDTDQEFESDNNKKVKKGRPLWLMLIIILAALYFMFTLKADLLFYFMKSEPISLGNVIEYKPTDLPDNSYVKITGIRNPSRGIRLNTIFNDRNVFQLMGNRLVFVETLAENDKKTSQLSEKTFKGRLLRFADVSYFNTVCDFAAFNFGFEVDQDSILIKAHEKPGDSIETLVIFSVLLAIIILNLFLLIRRLKNRNN